MPAPYEPDAYQPPDPLLDRTIPGPLNYDAPASQKLFLPGQQPEHAASYGDQTATLPPPTAPLSEHLTVPQPVPDATFYGGAPTPNPSLDPTLPAAHRPAQHRTNAVGWLVVICTMVAIIIVLVVLFSNLLSPAPSSKNTTTNTITPQSQTTPVTHATPAPTSQATSAATVNPNAPSKTFDGIVITPAQLQLQNDCQPDNGYRCTVTLSAPADTQSSLPWWTSISTSTAGDQVNTRHGELTAGQQAQIIIYIRHQCPYNSILDVQVNDQHTDVPIDC